MALEVGEQIVQGFATDADGRLLSGGSGTAASVSSGRKVVTTAGTRVALGTDVTGMASVAVQALHANTGVIVVGGGAVVAAVATRNGIALNPGDVVSIDVSKLSAIYLDAMVNGEGVSFVVTAA